jgi:hypothetical protein
MVAYEPSERLTRTPSSIPGIALRVVIGVIVGAVTVYVTAFVATAPIPGNFTINPLTLLMLAIVASIAVVTGWRWPVVGVSAGIVVLLVVGFAVVTHVAWLQAGANWLNPFNAIGFAAVSGYPAMMGAAMLTVSGLRLWSRRAG